MKALALVGLTLAFLLSGCTPSLYGYERIRISEQHISEEMREAIVNDGLAREQVIEKLGEPNGINDEVHSIVYSRCVRSTGWGVFGPGRVDSCQRVVFWFDDKGRAYAEKSGIAHCGEDESCFGRSFSQWLAAPPQSKERK